MTGSDNFVTVQAGDAQLPNVQMPVVSRERFAELSGLTAATVYGMCDRGFLPVIHFGRRVLVNMEAIRAQCADKVLL